MPQGSDECDRLPCSLRNMTDQSLATRATSVRRTILMLVAVSSTNTSRVVSRKALLPKPAPPRSRSVLLGCPQAFFERDAMAIKESPERAATAWDPSLSHRCNNLVQRSVRLLGNQGKDALAIVFQNRTATAARFRRTHPVITPALQPFDRRAGADLKALGRLTPRRPRFHCFDNALTQVTRQCFRHRRSPHRRINADRLVQPDR